jgi:type IV secretion system protein TrbI
MSDTPAGTTPVKDHRAAPTGPVSRRTQTWFMVGFAAVILIVIIFAHPAPPAAPKAAPPTPSPLTAERLRDYQQRMRTQETPFSTPPPAAVAQAPLALDDPETPAPPDPLEAERAKREYDSLFASPLVYTRRPAGSVGQWSPRDSQARQHLASQVTDGPPAPDLDSVAEAVLRATAKHSVTGVQASPTELAADAAQGAPSGPGSVTPPRSTPPISPAGPGHPILEGTVIEAKLYNQLDGAKDSPVICQISAPVFSHAGHRVLIPAGAVMLGRAKPIDGAGQSRLDATFHRLIFPDGRTVAIDGFVALDLRGGLGLRDRVNRHHLSTLTSAAAAGAIVGATQALSNAGLGASADRTIVIAGGADSASRVAADALNRSSSRSSEAEIRHNHPVRIYVTSDLELPAYP